MARAREAPAIEGRSPEPSPDITEGERAFCEAVLPRVPAAPPFQPVHAVEDGSPICVGEVKVIALPGHTPEANGRAIVGPFNVDRVAARQSFRRVAGFDVDVLGVGHGEPFVGNATEALAPTVAWLDLR